MQQGVFKVHLAANSLRSNRVSSQSQLCTSSYHVKVLQSSVPDAISASAYQLSQRHTPPPFALPTEISRAEHL